MKSSLLTTETRGYSSSDAIQDIGEIHQALSRRRAFLSSINISATGMYVRIPFRFGVMSSLDLAICSLAQCATERELANQPIQLPPPPDTETDLSLNHYSVSLLSESISCLHVLEQALVFQTPKKCAHEHEIRSIKRVIAQISMLQGPESCFVGRMC